VSPTEALPLLIVVVLLISTSGADVDRMEVTFQGDHDIETVDDVLVIAGGTATVPANTVVEGDLYAIGGTTEIEGEVSGDVTVLAGNVSVSDGATVAGTLQQVAGDFSVEEGAMISEITSFEPPAPSDSPARQVGAFVIQFLVLGAAGWWFARRRPALLENVGHSITEHALVSGVVGSLAATALLVLFVYMAFTLVLIPVSIFGLLGQVVIVLYAQVVYGYLIGRRLSTDHPEVATVVGVGVLLLALELSGLVPYLGPAVQLVVVVVGFGAVLNTYFGLQQFKPATVPDVRN
jgi:cytoskeletal protein CcmA (bactofilin family)